MNKRTSQKKELDRIGRELFETARVSDDEIERIVAAPQLFSAVKTRINAEQMRRERESSFANRKVAPFWSWQKVSAAAAAFLLFAFGILGFIEISDSTKIDERAVAVPEIQTRIEKIEISPSPQISIVPQKAKRIENPEQKYQTVAQKAAIKLPNIKKPKRKPQPFETPKIEPNNRFYALTYAGNIGEKGEELHVIRTELSPSTLFALGVNLPIENAPEKIKTDLLIGTDGVARAIRFVD